MSDRPITIGDIVTWKPKYRHKGTPETLTGRVKSLHSGRKPWAGVAVDHKPGNTWCVDLDRLQRVENAPEAVAVTAPIVEPPGIDDTAYLLLQTGSLS